MKRLVIAVVILAVIIVAGVLESVAANKTFDELEARLCALETAIKSPDDDALDEVKELTAWWEDKRAGMELYTWSPDMRAFSVALAETEGSLECGDDMNALSKCQSLLTMAKTSATSSTSTPPTSSDGRRRGVRGRAFLAVPTPRADAF